MFGYKQVEKCEQEAAGPLNPPLDYGQMGQINKTGKGSSYRPQPPTLREEAEKMVGYHRSEADKSDKAVAFFRDNPAFDEFVRLIRSGVIQLALLLVVLSAHAGEVPKAPVIPDAQQKQFFKASAEYANAQMAAKAASDAVKTAEDKYNVTIKGMQDTCGPLWQAQLDNDKNPFCAEKPAAPKPAENK